MLQGRPKRQQVHLWLQPSEYRFLKRLAKHRDESVSRLLRRLIGSWRMQLGNQKGLLATGATKPNGKPG